MLSNPPNDSSAHYNKLSSLQDSATCHEHQKLQATKRTYLDDFSKHDQGAKCGSWDLVSTLL